MRMVAASSCSLDCLREGGWHGQQNNNLTEKNAVRKSLEWWEKIKTEENTPSPSSPYNRQHREVVAGPCSLD
jgi:hypothetical protein